MIITTNGVKVIKDLNFNGFEIFLNLNYDIDIYYDIPGIRHLFEHFIFDGNLTSRSNGWTSLGHVAFSLSDVYFEDIKHMIELFYTKEGYERINLIKYYNFESCICDVDNEYKWDNPIKNIIPLFYNNSINDCGNCAIFKDKNMLKIMKEIWNSISGEDIIIKVPKFYYDETLPLIIKTFGTKRKTFFEFDKIKSLGFNANNIYDLNDKEEKKYKTLISNVYNNIYSTLTIRFDIDDIEMVSSFVHRLMFYFKIEVESITIGNSIFVLFFFPNPNYIRTMLNIFKKEDYSYLKVKPPIPSLFYFETGPSLLFNKLKDQNTDNLINWFRSTFNRYTSELGRIIVTFGDSLFPKENSVDRDGLNYSLYTSYDNFYADNTYYNNRQLDSCIDSRNYYICKYNPSVKISLKKVKTMTVESSKLPMLLRISYLCNIMNITESNITFEYNEKHHDLINKYFNYYNEGSSIANFSSVDYITLFNTFSCFFNYDTFFSLEKILFQLHKNINLPLYTTKNSGFNFKNNIINIMSRLPFSAIVFKRHKNFTYEDATQLSFNLKQGKLSYTVMSKLSNKSSLIFIPTEYIDEAFRYTTDFIFSKIGHFKYIHIRGNKSMSYDFSNITIKFKTDVMNIINGK